MLSSGWHAWPERRIAILTKVPAPGRTKTRLAATIGPQAAAAIARAFLDDTLALAARVAREVGATLVVHTDPDDPGPDFLALLRAHGAAHAAQGAGDLGARLRRALDAAPAAARVVVGTDAPDLPAAYLVGAYGALARRPVVLGPTDASDGGYHLLGLAPGAPAAWLEAPIRWSTRDALADTTAAATAAGLGVGNGPAWPDVDDASGLALLATRLAGVEAPDVAPRTRAWLAANTRPLLDEAGSASS